MTGRLHPRISVNAASSISWTLGQDIALYEAYGVRNVTASYAKFRNGPTDGVRALEAAGIQAVALSAGAGPLLEGMELALELLSAPVELARALGCPSVYCMSGPTPPRMSTDEAYDRLVETLRPAAAHAGSRGVRLAIEPNSQASRHHGFVHTLPDAIELSQDTGAGICLELQNCWYERHLARLFRENVDRFVVVQVSDFLVGEELKFNRRVPGDGSMPLEWMLGLLLEAGYEGVFDLECLGPAIEREGYPDSIRRGLDWLSNRLEALGA